MIDVRRFARGLFLSKSYFEVLNTLFQWKIVFVLHKNP